MWGMQPIGRGERVIVSCRLGKKPTWLALAPVLIILALCFMVWGCTQKKAETKLPLTLSKPQIGYVYIAALMPAHPLYAQLSALQNYIDALRGVGEPALAEAINRLYESPLLMPPSASSGMEGIDQYRNNWLAGEDWDIFGGGRGLPGDLQAQLSWERSRIDRKVLQQLQQAAAQESQWLAYLQIEAMIRRQPEVTDQELDLSESPTEASRKAEQLRAEIVEDAIGEELAASRARLEKLRQDLETDRGQSLSEIRDRLQASAQQRQSYTAAASRKLQQQLAERIQQFTGTIEPLDKAMVGAAPSVEQLQQAGQQHSDAQKEYNQAVAAQIEQLLAREMALSGAIEQATRRAVQRIGWEENLDLHLVPGDEKVGDDRTTFIAEKLAAMWASPKTAAEEANSQ